VAASRQGYKASFSQQRGKGKFGDAIHSSLIGHPIINTDSLGYESSAAPRQHMRCSGSVQTSIDTEELYWRNIALMINHRRYVARLAAR